MIINWPLIIVLFGLSLPGVCLVLPRLIYFVLLESPELLKQRYARFAVLQTLVVVFIMSLGGAVLSGHTGLHAPLLEAILGGHAGLSSLIPILIPTLLYALGGLIIFCCLYYGLVASIIDEKNFQIMENMRSALGLDGCVLYGVVEEVIGRWGLMNAVVFFAMLLTGKPLPIVIVVAIVFSGLILAVGQIPAYIAAGCSSNRPVVYSIVFLSLTQSLLFGFLFWQYGLISAILAHMLFHLGWACVDKVKG